VSGSNFFRLYRVCGGESSPRFIRRLYSFFCSGFHVGQVRSRYPLRVSPSPRQFFSSSFRVAGFSSIRFSFRGLARAAAGSSPISFIEVTCLAPVPLKFRFCRSMPPSQLPARDFRFAPLIFGPVRGFGVSAVCFFFFRGVTRVGFSSRDRVLGSRPSFSCSWPIWISPYFSRSRLVSAARESFGTVVLALFLTGQGKKFVSLFFCDQFPRCSSCPTACSAWIVFHCGSAGMCFACLVFNFLLPRTGSPALLDL
jgi:hypothetical protein